MSLFETMGLFWTVGTSALGTIALGYFAWRGISDYIDSAKRGEQAPSFPSDKA